MSGCFDNPSLLAVSGPNFGAIISTVGTPRIIPFSLPESL
jgi:hypothetical protein